MLLKHGIVIHFVNMVTGNNKYIFRIKLLDISSVLVNGMCCAIIPTLFVSALIGRENT
jgi:hypothetical protein